jgi:hypothetical protein
MQRAFAQSRLSRAQVLKAAFIAQLLRHGSAFAHAAAQLSSSTSGRICCAFQRGDGCYLQGSFPLPMLSIRNIQQSILNPRVRTGCTSLICTQHSCTIQLSPVKLTTAADK